MRSVTIILKSDNRHLMITIIASYIKFPSDRFGHRGSVEILCEFEFLSAI